MGYIKIHKYLKMRSKPIDEVGYEENRDNPLLEKTVRYRSFFKLTLMILNICMSPFYFGYTIQYLGTFDIELTMKLYNITSMSKETANGLLQGCVPIGAGIGALTSFLLLKYLSRKY